MSRILLLALVLGLLPVNVLAAGVGTDATGTTVADGQGSNSAQIRETPALGQNVERQLPPEGDFTPFVKDFGEQKDIQGDHVETRKVMVDGVKTIKLPNVVPPIHFDSGDATIPKEYIEKVRAVLASMSDKKNVRLHLVGYTDNVKLRGAAKAKYVDNNGLSRERAGVAAEFFQRALHLPPESISYEGRGESNPVASNKTAAGRRQNRRMEVEVWYDVPEKKQVEKKVVISELIRRIKVCRVEQVCKLSYKTGMAKRARVKNLIAPLHFDESSTRVPADYVQKLAQVMQNLQNKRNVVIKFIAYTDNSPLAGRDARIYGNQLGLSKARARRVALAVQDALHLPSSAIESDGMGSANPVAPNDSEAGKAANNRVEAEFWYDDALQQLSSEPQLCPGAAGAETVTRVYHPPSGPIPPVMWENGKPVIPAGYADNLRTLLAQVKDKTRVRLRFIGFIKDERLDRRTALAYGDDIGLSTARAYTVMKDIQSRLNLSNAQVEHEGHGYVHSNDVVNAGFVEGDDSKVAVQIVYDDLAGLDNNDELDITRMTREVPVANPYGLNPMRITVDGTPIDDKGKDIADIDRCTDVKLERADIQFKYDNLNLKPRLNVTAWPNSIRYQDDPATPFVDDMVHFRAYSNFPYFISHSEVRLFDQGQSVRDKPLATIPVDKDGNAQWEAKFEAVHTPGRDLKFVLRVYDKDGNFDETTPQTLWVRDGEVPEKVRQAKADKELLAGYGENRLSVQNIPLSGGTVEAYGTHVPEQHTVYLAGHAVPVNDEGKFTAEEILPSGLHTVEVAVLDPNGNGQLYQRDMDLKKNDWFYVAIADLTASKASVSGPASIVTNDTQGHYDNGLALDGRLAFYTNGKFGDDWQLTASADTLEGPVKGLFSNFMQKSPDAFFRRVNPDYYYPTYGDDSTTEQTAPTLGKFYVKLKKRDNYGMWGNFKLGYTENSLTQVQRTLYGANLHVQPQDTTSFGEKRLVVDGFVAQPGTVAGRDDFRGTGGSLYYLRHQDIMQGSDHVRLEVRDKVSGMVLSVKNLTYGLDYTIDYLQGRVLLNAPLSPYASDKLLVSSDVSTGGNAAYLVVQYEYSTGFQDTANLSTGGTAHYWLNDHVKVGVTRDKSNEVGSETDLKGSDITLRKNAHTWLKYEKSTSSGPGTAVLGSYDGGFSFAPANNFATNTTSTLATPPGGTHGASRIDGSIGLDDLYGKANGQMTFYHQRVEGGYSAPGLSTPTLTNQYGGTLKTALSDKVDVRMKGDRSAQALALRTTALEADIDYRASQNWTISSGGRYDSRTDYAPVVAPTQVQGRRKDAVVKVTYDSHEKWSAYTFAQDTVSQTGNRGTNNRGGVGGAYQVSDKFRMNGEASAGDAGRAAKLGTEYLYSDKSTAYVNYALENDRTDNGVAAHKGTATAGVKEHYSDTTDIFQEEKYTYGDVPTGLTHSTGVQYVPDDRWNFKVNLDSGSLRDNLTGAKIEHTAVGESFGYGVKGAAVASSVEYRQDLMQSPVDMTFSTRITWLTKNSAKYQIDPDWRFIGRLNYSRSRSSMGEFYDGTYTELVAGYGYRPVDNDRLNMLFKYTYFYNLPSAGQVTIANTAAAYIQKDHILSLDVSYDVTSRWTLGGKYAHRTGQVSQDRVNPVFFQSNANLYIARVDWHFVREWDFMTEGRILSLPNAHDTRRGALIALYRQLGNYVKLGAGYNFTSFSDDLTNLGYTYHGVFINLVGKM